MKIQCFWLSACCLLFAGCGVHDNNVPQTTSGPGSHPSSLRAARQGFQTTTVSRGDERMPVEEPPSDLFQIVRYKSTVGELPAYLTVDPQDGQKHPAIVWITGGDCNSIGSVWDEADESNDQTAAAYREAGIVMMFPSLRGGNENPGAREGFFGEVDDVLAAADFLATQTYVDPSRIYLGGHSTGGTLALLVAECSDRFRAVFSFGPVDDVSRYGPEYSPFNTSSRKEIELRSPVYWLQATRTPAFVIEGIEPPVSNAECLQAMTNASNNPSVRFLPVAGADHFSVLARSNQLIASKILMDQGERTNLTMSAPELNALFGR